MIELYGKYTSAKIMTDDLEPECISQIERIINHPVFTNQVVIMPDAHAGKGSVIGFTMPLSDFVIPNVIGVDIGCGMVCASIGNDLKEHPEKADKKIQSVVPMGTSIHKKQVFQDFNYNEINKRLSLFLKAIRKRFNIDVQPIEIDKYWIKDKIRQTGIEPERFFNSVGTLGGGNHFIEIGKSEDEYFLTIHSGSRNFGLKTAEYWQNVAIKNMSSEDETSDRKSKKSKKIPFRDRELACLEGKEMMSYLIDMLFAQYYAHLNRMKMLELITDKLHWQIQGELIESVHNYIDLSDFIIRKGAIKAMEGQKLIIPFNMRDGIMICEGKGNQEWNYSAPHGAGRIMSRSKAKQLIDLEEYRNSMKGIYSSCINKDTIDESPMVYKNPALIERLIEPTAKVLFKIKPVLNIKAAE